MLLFSFATAVNAQRKTWYGTPVATIPFTMYHSGVMVIKAKYENQADSLRFILDTGSGGASLDSTTCVIHGIKTEPSDITVSGIGARRKVHFVYNKTLDFPGITMERFNFHVNNYEVLTGVYGEKIDGIIGYQLFQRYTVFIDFDDGVIHLYEPGTFKKRRFRGKKLQTRINAIPSLDLEIEDNKTLSTPVYFDTGAGLNLLLSEQFIQDSTILSPAKKLINSQVEGMNGIIHMRYTTLEKVKLGRYTFKNVPTFLYNDVSNVLSYPRHTGLIGNDLLRRFNLLIDYDAKEIYMKPNKHFRDVFDYSYSGLNIFKEGGDIVVESVIPGSPAAAAGVLPNDILVGVNLTFGEKLQALRTELQKIGTHRLILQRGNDLIELKIKVISIL